ncbi:MAG: hypothetical protein OZ919_12240, partial [Xanthomonadaceae bacterium]|nr:hypothetical protein [Xanthomonadaceae bacterium]
MRGAGAGGTLDSAGWDVWHGTYSALNNLQSDKKTTVYYVNYGIYRRRPPDNFDSNPGRFVIEVMP